MRTHHVTQTYSRGTTAAVIRNYTPPVDLKTHNRDTIAVVRNYIPQLTAPSRSSHRPLTQVTAKGVTFGALLCSDSASLARDSLVFLRSYAFVWLQFAICFLIGTVSYAAPQKYHKVDRPQGYRVTRVCSEKPCSENGVTLPAVGFVL